MKRISVILTLILSFAVTAACSSATGENKDKGAAAGSNNQTRAVNKSLTITRADNSGVVTLVSVTESYHPKGETVEPKNGNFVGVELKFEGKTGKFSVSPMYFKLKTSDGALVDVHKGGNSQLATSDELTFGEDLGPGQTLTGVIAIDIAYDPGAALLATDGMGQVNGEWPLSGAGS